MDYTKLKFDIIVVAGQSNAEGNGTSLDDYIVIPNRAFELVDANDYTLVTSGPDTGHLVCHLPVQCKIQRLQERGNYTESKADLSLGFVPEYISRYLEPDRNVLVIKAAYGGTGFALKQQGVGNPLYTRLVDMVNAGLKLNKDNRIVAFLWHQGEHDAFEQPSLNEKERYEFYYTHLKEQFVCFRNEYKQFSFPIITGQFCHEWRNQECNIKQCEVVEQATIDVCGDIGKAGFVTSEDLLSNNQAIYNGDGIHFSHDSVIELGRRYFKVYQKIR